MGFSKELGLNEISTSSRIIDQAKKWEDIMRANKAQMLLDGDELESVAKAFTDERGCLNVWGALATVYMAAYVDGVEQLPAYDEECPE